jgi:hypothetical protein
MILVLGCVDIVLEDTVDAAHPIEKLFGVGLALFTEKKMKTQTVTNTSKRNGRCTPSGKKPSPIICPCLVDDLLLLRFLQFFQSFEFLSKFSLKFNTNFSLAHCKFD